MGQTDRTGGTSGDKQSVKQETRTLTGQDSGLYALRSEKNQRGCAMTRLERHRVRIDWWIVCREDAHTNREKHGIDQTANQLVDHLCEAGR
jgi:hypothetical protein